MQGEEQLIHKLHTSLIELLVKILGRIGDPKIIVQADKITKDSFAKDVDKHKLNIRDHYVALHILAKTSQDNHIMKTLKYTSPAYILEPESGEKIIEVAKLLFPISPTIAMVEWNLIKAKVVVKRTCYM